MKIEHLKEFYTLANYLNFTITAEHLYITQPALSRHIALVEEELGTALLKRTTKSVELTEAGEMLRAALSPIISQYDTVIEQIKNLGKDSKATLRIGIPAVAVNDYLGQAPRVFQERYPEVEMQYVFNEPEDNIRALLHGELDMIMIAHIPFPNAEQLDFYDCITEPLVVICREDDPIAGKDSVKLEDLKSYSFVCNGSNYYSVIWNKILAQCQWSGFTPEPPLIVDQMDAVLASVRQGYGITIVGAHHHTLAANGLTYVVLNEPGCYRRLSIAHKHSNRNPMIQAFIDIFSTHGGEPLREHSTPETPTQE